MVSELATGGARVIKEITGVEYHSGHVWRILRSLDWTRQRPARRAKEWNEKAIKEWVAKDGCYKGEVENFPLITARAH